MSTTTTPTRFSSAVQQVRLGTSAEEVAEQMLKELTPDEPLSLLDGDLPFWEGFADSGDNRTPVPRCRGSLA